MKSAQFRLTALHAIPFDANFAHTDAQLTGATVYAIAGDDATCSVSVKGQRQLQNLRQQRKTYCLVKAVRLGSGWYVLLIARPYNSYPVMTHRNW